MSLSTEYAEAGSTLSSHVPVLSAASVVAGFEVGVLVRSAWTGSGRYRPGAMRSTVELSRGAAADRLGALLRHLDLPAHRDEYDAGGRHRYTVHRVVCPMLDDAALAAAWCAGYRRLCSVDRYRTARQREHRGELAEAAWRAALLASALRRRHGRIAVRIADTDLAVALMHAARVLDVAVRLRTSARRHLVEVTAAPADAAARDRALA